MMSEKDSPGELGLTAGSKPNIPEYSVSEISKALKRMIERDFALVRIQGEISGFRGVHSSGHAYFGLKEEDAKIDAVCWRGSYQRLRSKIVEGMQVVVTGRVTTYPGKSSYQVVVENVEPAGIGALMQMLEERRKKLQAEGLFDDEHKKPIPFLPRVIGVVTSPTGSVIQDILHRLSDRFPRRVLVWPVAVQGEKCAAEVSQAIAGFNRLPVDGPVPRPDVIIVARGGGSIEDLWPFNDEAIVRAVFASQIPLISAVGHETDTTLIDLVADRRAPTPSAAAEMAVPVRTELVKSLTELSGRLKAGLYRPLLQGRQRLQDLARGLPARHLLMEGPQQRLDIASTKLSSSLRSTLLKQRSRFDRIAAMLSTAPLRQANAIKFERINNLAHRAGLAVTRRLQIARQHLTADAKLLETLGHRATLARGFAYVTKSGLGLVRSPRDVATGDHVRITMAEGDVQAIVSSADTLPPSKTKPKAKPAGQGDLF